MRVAVRVQGTVSGRKLIKGGTKVRSSSSLQLYTNTTATVERGNSGHLYTFRSILKILRDIFWSFFLHKSWYELWYFRYQYQKPWYWSRKYHIFFEMQGGRCYPAVWLTPATLHFFIYRPIISLTRANTGHQTKF